MRSYCVKQRKETLCVPGSEIYKTIKNGRLMMSCICAECGATKTRFVKKTDKKGAGIASTVADTGLEMFIQHSIPWLGKQAVKMGRYYGSEFLRQPEYQKKIANKAKQLSQKGVNYSIDALSKDLLNKAFDRHEKGW